MKNTRPRTGKTARRAITPSTSRGSACGAPAGWSCSAARRRRSRITRAPRPGVFRSCGCANARRRSRCPERTSSTWRANSRPAATGSSAPRSSPRSASGSNAARRACCSSTAAAPRVSCCAARAATCPTANAARPRSCCTATRAGCAATTATRSAPIPGDLPVVRLGPDRAVRHRHAARRGGSGSALSRRAHRAHGCRHDDPDRRSRPLARSLRARSRRARSARKWSRRVWTFPR